MGTASASRGASASNAALDAGCQRFGHAAPSYNRLQQHASTQICMTLRIELCLSGAGSLYMVGCVVCVLACVFAWLLASGCFFDWSVGCCVCVCVCMCVVWPVACSLVCLRARLFVCLRSLVRRTCARWYCVRIFVLRECRSRNTATGGMHVCC